MTCVAGGNLSRGEFQNTEPYSYKHPRFIIGTDGVVHIFDDFGRRAAQARSVADENIGDHHKERGGNTLAGNVRHHQREVVVVNQKIVIKIAADLFGRLHIGIEVKIFSFGECRESVRNGVFLNPFCHGKLRADAFLFRCHGGEIFNVFQHFLFHFINGMAQAGNLVNSADNIQPLALGVFRGKALCFRGYLPDWPRDILADIFCVGDDNESRQNNRRNGNPGKVFHPGMHIGNGHLRAKHCRYLPAVIPDRMHAGDISFIAVQFRSANQSGIGDIIVRIQFLKLSFERVVGICFDLSD